MKIKFLGASSGIVTGSSYVLTSDAGISILIDLGMFQGVPEVEKLNYEPYDFDPSKLAGAVLTHAHLDHCGRLPIILPRGFAGDIWMTKETRDLTELSLFDTAKIAKNNDKPFLFDEKLVEKTIAKFKTVDLHNKFKIGDFEIEMYDAGHILGSTSLKITNAGRSIIFSGDLGNSPEPLENPTETFDSADFVVMESTYGDRLHPKGDPGQIVASEINAIEKEGGVLLIPAFSLERTQELLHIVMHLKKDAKIKAETPVILDSPMAQKATNIYISAKASLNSHIQNDFEGGSPFEFPGLNIIENHHQSEELYKDMGPKVIIAGAGMMTGGKIVGHAAHYLPIESTRLLIVGYQGEGTLGRQILEGAKKVNIEGLDVEVKANINNMQTMSSHADQSQLISWLKVIKGTKKLFLTHGEDASRKALAAKITSDLGLKDIHLPVLSEEIDF